MVKMCSASGCSNTTSKSSCKEKRISLHHFPLQDEKRMQQWLTKMRRKNFKPNGNHVICSEHFTEEDFEYQLFTNRRLLKETAVPSKFGSVSSDEDSDTTVKRRKRRKISSLSDSCSNTHSEPSCKEKALSRPNFPLQNEKRMLQFLIKMEQNDFKSNENVVICSESFAKKDLDSHLLTNQRLEKETAAPRFFVSTKEGTHKFKNEKFTKLPSSSDPCSVPCMCSSFMCNNSSSDAVCKEKNISFHKFPLQDSKRLQQWLLKMERKDFKPNGNHVICSEHFIEEDFGYEMSSNRRFLKETAVPSQFCFLYAKDKTSEGKRKKISSISDPCRLAVACDPYSGSIQKVLGTYPANKDVTTQTDEDLISALVTETVALRDQIKNLNRQLQRATSQVSNKVLSPYASTGLNSFISDAETPNTSLGCEGRKS